MQDFDRQYFTGTNHDELMLSMRHHFPQTVAQAPRPPMSEYQMWAQQNNLETRTQKVLKEPPPAPIYLYKEGYSDEDYDDSILDTPVDPHVATKYATTYEKDEAIYRAHLRFRDRTKRLNREITAARETVERAKRTEALGVYADPVIANQMDAARFHMSGRHLETLPYLKNFLLNSDTYEIAQAKVAMQIFERDQALRNFPSEATRNFYLSSVKRRPVKTAYGSAFPYAVANEYALQHLARGKELPKTYDEDPVTFTMQAQDRILRRVVYNNNLAAHLLAEGNELEEEPGMR